MPRKERGDGCWATEKCGQQGPWKDWKDWSAWRPWKGPSEDSTCVSVTGPLCRSLDAEGGGWKMETKWIHGWRAAQEQGRELRGPRYPPQQPRGRWCGQRRWVLRLPGRGLRGSSTVTWLAGWGGWEWPAWWLRMDTPALRVRLGAGHEHEGHRAQWFTKWECPGGHPSLLGGMQTSSLWVLAAMRRAWWDQQLARRS